MSEPLLRPAYLHPRYWPVWLGFGFWWLLVQLPLPVQTVIANRLGDLLCLLRTRRVRVAARNLELCFPEMTPDRRRQLLRDNMRRTCMGFFETGISWWWPTEKIMRHVDVEGSEHLEQLHGQGALLLGFHFTCLEIAGVAMTSRYPVDMVYRPHNNELYDTFQRRGRTSNGNHRDDGLLPSQLLDRADLRGMVKALRGGRIVWSAFDQDPGKRKGVFAPFFGIPTATLGAAGVIARMAGVPVLPLLKYRRRNGRYCIRVMPPMSGFPTGDEQLDAERYNQVAEELIRLQPESYLWVHRRFKTRPPGADDLYAGL